MSKAKTKFDKKRVKRAAQTGAFKSLAHAGAAIRLTARRSIKRSAEPAAAGSAPHTRKGRIKAAIKYAVDKNKQSVVIGPDEVVTGTAGKAHEFGGKYRKQTYDKRPFMAPALEKNQARLPALWSGSVRK